MEVMASIHICLLRGSYQSEMDPFSHDPVLSVLSRLSKKLGEILFRESDGGKDILFRIFISTILHFDHAAAVIADVIQCRDESTPVHVASLRDGEGYFDAL